MLWALCLAFAAEKPSDQTVIYYNARMALREGRPLEATRLWLLRNAVEDHTGRLSSHDADFHSVTWAALGEMGICQDGFPQDSEGAGLWPLGLHNWLVQNRRKRAKTKKPNPFNAFELDRQQRFISIGDVLSVEELKTVTLFKGGCLAARVAFLQSGEPTGKMSDKQEASRLLEFLIKRAQFTLDHDRVRGLAALDARLFDISLQQANLAAREAKAKQNAQARRGREVGLSKASVEEVREDAPEYTFSEDSDAARVLRESVDWEVSEWMALSPERRLFVFDHAVKYGGDPDKLDAIALSVIDALIEEGDGTQAQKWIAHRPYADQTDAIWSGERGRNLMALDDEAGFGERGVIAIHRGVSLLEAGDLPGSLRSMAFALQKAPESKEAEALNGLALRWMGYIASQFEITDELLIMLQQLIPRREYSVLLEDLMWSAALRADKASFERGARNQTGRGALIRRAALLQPLASGSVGQFSNRIRVGLKESPSETMRFLDQMVQRLELEDADVRGAHRITLTQLRRLLAPLADPASKGRQGRRADALMVRTQGILEGLGIEASNERDRARGLDPRTEVFAGSVRLAPADPLPWPFRTSRVRAPSVFEPIKLTPIEWRDEHGALVFGWSLTG